MIIASSAACWSSAPRACCIRCRVCITRRSCPTRSARPTGWLTRGSAFARPMTNMASRSTRTTCSTTPTPPSVTRTRATPPSSAGATRASSVWNSAPSSDLSQPPTGSRARLDLRIGPGLCFWVHASIRRHEKAAPAVAGTAFQMRSFKAQSTIRSSPNFAFTTGSLLAAAVCSPAGSRIQFQKRRTSSGLLTAER